MEPSLASWVDDVLFPGTLALHGQGTGNGCAVTFVSVGGKGKPESAKRLRFFLERRQLRESQTHEIDLAGNRSGTERVPVDLLAGLLRHGYANFREAQKSVIRSTLHEAHLQEQLRKPAAR